MEHWLIRKRGYFYRPDRKGYTANVHEAGRYTREEAEATARIDPSIISAHPLSEFLPPVQKAPYAELPELQAWAAFLMGSRDPDFIIGKAGQQPDYMHRWWVIPRNKMLNVYLHRVMRSDDDRALHDHPWANTSLIISGGYLEVTPEGEFQRNPGDVVSRDADALHRLVVPEGGECVSLFMTGPKVREWGFDCPNGWKPWEQFEHENGCGEN